MRFFHLFVCLVASLWLQQAAANAPRTQPAAIALSQLGSSIGSPQLSIQENLPRSRTVDSIASDTALFTQVFDPSIAYAMGTDSATWLHLRVLADDKPAPTGWTLELTKPYIQYVEFHYKDALGNWQMQVSGGKIPHTQWPMQSLCPQFALPVMAAGTHDFYLKMQSNMPVHFSINLQRADSANLRAQHGFLLSGVLLGVCALMLAFSAVLAFSSGQKSYGWYALFVGLSCLATITNTGLSKYALWPRAAVWPEYSIYALVMVAFVAQLQFCRAIFLPSSERTWLHALLWGTMALSLAAIGFFLVSDHALHRVILYSFVACFCSVVAVVLVVRALRKGNLIAWLWLIAYAPLIVCVGLASLDSFGFAINGLSFDAPVYALLFEVSVLLIALHVHARLLHMQTVRREVMDSIDPHTGFVAEHLYEETLAQLWSEAHKRQSDLTVVYVEAKSGTTQPAESIVRLLRTVVRDIDTVAHVDKNLYAILMVGQRVGTSLTNRLSRLVALGLMAGHNLEQSGTIQFRIVATSKAVFAGTWQQVDALLREKILNPTGWSNKSIRYVRLRSPNAPNPDPDSDSDSEKLSQLWDVALTESARLDAAKA